MFWEVKEKQSDIVDKFFDGDITYTHLENKGSTQYSLRNGLYELTILVFNNSVSDMSWQISLKKDGALIPLEDFEFKLFSERVKEYIRKIF